MAFAVAIFTILAIIGLIELVELIRRVSHKEQAVPFLTVLEMALMKVPFTAEKILPFAVLIGAMVSLSKLTKSSELIIARASGISVWQFLLPVFLTAMLIGMFFTMVFNPLSSAMITRFEALEGRYITGKPSVLAVSPSGLWVRQVEREMTTSFNKKPIGEYIIHAKRISQQDMSLTQVIIFIFGEDKQFLGRIDAPLTRLQEGYWDIHQPMVSAPGLMSQTLSNYKLETELSIEQIQESYASPKTLSFWELPNFIYVLETAGFSALRHKLHFQTLLSTPFILGSMIMIAAMFSLRIHRRGKISIMIAGGVISGFLVYFTSNLVYALGFSGGLPVILAAWTPPLVTIMVATTVLLHVEDG